MADDKTDCERALEEQPEFTPEMRAAQARREREELELARAYKRLFDGVDGQTVLGDLRNLFEKRTSLHENMAVTQGNEGKRFVILHILAQIELAEINRGSIPTASAE